MGGGDSTFRLLDIVLHSIVLLTAFGLAQSKCPPPYQFDCDLDLCLYENHEVNTFDRSVEICKENDGVLSSTPITGNYMFGTSDGYWVGVEDKGTGDGPKLLDGSDIPSEAYWYYKVPDAAYSRMCGWMRKSGMTMERCDRKERSLCERKPATCPEHWYPIAGDCVKIFQSTNTWEDANKACKEIGAQPLIIPTDAHAKGIEDFLNLQHDSWGQYWTGAKKEDDSAKITWHDGSTVEDLQHLSLEPLTSGGHQVGKCGRLSLSTMHRQLVLQMEIACLSSTRHMCFLAGDSPDPKPSAPVNPPPEMDQGNCGEGWEAHPGTDTCYSFIDNGHMCAHQATRACEAIGGTLVSIASHKEEHYLKKRLHQMTESNFWIGLQMTEDRGWHWSDGSAFAYTSWSPDIDKHSVYVRAGLLRKSKMEWDVNQHEDIYAAAICEKHQKEHSVCDASWYGFENHCYFLSDEKRTWVEARNVCKVHDADLATIQNLEENDFIFSEFAMDCGDKDSRCDDWVKSGHCVTKPLHMGGVCPKACGFCNGNCSNESPQHLCSLWANEGKCESNYDFMMEECQHICGCDAAIHNGFWIGLHNQKDVHQYEWASTSEVNFTHWSVNEPDNYGRNGEECIIMRVHNGLWADKSCDTKSRGFVCQKTKSIKDKKILDPTIDGCPHGEIEYEDKCYSFRKKSVTWEEAKTACEHNNQSLANITNKDAHEFLHTEIGRLSLHGIPDVWIGLHYLDSSIGKIEDWLKDGKCPELEYPSWGVVPCTQKNYFLCESNRDVYKNPTVTVPPTQSGDDTKKPAKPDDETKELAKPDDETKELAKPDDETKKSAKPDDKTKKPAKPDDETKKLAKPDDETKKSAKPDDESKKPAKPNDETKKSAKPDDETKKPAKPDDETKKSAKPDDESKKSAKPDDETKKPDKPDDETKKPAKPDDESKKSAKPDDETKKPAKPDDESKKSAKPDDETKKSAKPDDETIKSAKPDVETKKLSKPDDETKKPAKPDDKIKKPAITDDEIKKLSKPDDQNKKPVLLVDKTKKSAKSAEDTKKLKEADEHGSVISGQRWDGKRKESAKSDQLSGDTITGVVIGVLGSLALIVGVLVVVYQYRNWPTRRQISIFRGDDCNDDFTSPICKTNHENIAVSTFSEA